MQVLKKTLWWRSSKKKTQRKTKDEKNENEDEETRVIKKEKEKFERPHFIIKRNWLDKTQRLQMKYIILQGISVQSK